MAESYGATHGDRYPARGALLLPATELFWEAG